MKRIATTLALALSAAALLTGASVWEGAAVAAAAGELPDSGYFVATNAFPKNTVVDVKNLENDKTVRAVVSGGLDAPGLLASLSREAASAIGLSYRDIGRVRMTMPADPIAFARFNEGFEPNGDPDRNPQAAIAAASAGTEALPAGAAPVLGSAPAPAADEETPIDLADAAPAEEAAAPVAAPVAAVTSPLEGTGAEAAPTTESPAAEAAPAAAVAAEAAPVEAAPAEAVAVVAPPEGSALAEEPLAAESAPTTPPAAETVAVIAPPAEAAPVDGALAAAEPAVVAEPTVEPVAAPAVVEAPVAPVAGTGPAVEPVPETAAPVGVPPGQTVDVALVPAEERPPVTTEAPALPAEAEVAPLAEPVVAPASAPAAAPEVVAPELAAAPLAAPVAAAALPPAETSTLPAFSAPVIALLEKGKYYLQLGAFGKPEAVEAALAKIGKTYPLAVQSAGSAANPVYRVLVGPVNLGESGALLQRFKRSGYKDAFVKQGS